MPGLTGLPPLMVVVLAVLAVLAWPVPHSRRLLQGSTAAPPAAEDPSWPGVVGVLRARWEARRRQAGAADDLADLVEVLVPPLQSGLATAEAVRAAASALDERPGLAQLTGALASAAAQGLPLGPVWAGQRVGAPPQVQLFLARAWSLSEETGVPLSVSLTAAGRVLRSRQTAERSLAAATAGARASMTLLALLPASGPAIGLLFGLTPMDLYARSPAAAGSLAVGVALGCAGWAWSRTILRRALQPEAVS